jgi:FAD/FMN-containing dehydrogenase
MTGITFRAPRQPLVPPGGADLHARDMTATFSAEMTLGEAQRRLGELGQWLPIDGDPDAPLGRLVEENSTGPLRLGYGAWRDLLLGVQFTNGRGELITAGGRTVKNVAGYDLTKFMVGQHGVFGRVVSLTVRTYRRPDTALLVRYLPDATIVSHLLATPLRPQWALLTSTALRCGYLGDEVTVAWYEANVGTSQPLHVTRRTVEQDVEDRANQWAWRLTGEQPTDVPFRASVPPARLNDFIKRVGNASWNADAAFGIAVGWARGDADRATVSGAASAVGGAVRFGAGASAEFSTNPGERQIIERLKAAFDPDGNLTPLPWQRR